MFKSRQVFRMQYFKNNFVSIHFVDLFMANYNLYYSGPGWMLPIHRNYQTFFKLAQMKSSQTTKTGQTLLLVCHQGNKWHKRSFTDLIIFMSVKKHTCEFRLHKSFYCLESLRRPHVQSFELRNHLDGKLNIFSYGIKVLFIYLLGWTQTHILKSLRLKKSDMEFLN